MKKDKCIKLAVLGTAVVLCGLVSIGYQVKAFGRGQATSSEDGKPILVNIQNKRSGFMINTLRGSVLVLQAIDDSEYQSTPILINGDQATCQFPTPVPVGQYRLRCKFASGLDVTVHPTSRKIQTLNITIFPNYVGNATDFIVRNKGADDPQTSVTQLDPSAQPAILSRVEPEYPLEAKGVGISGRVKLEAIVNEKGEVYEAKPLSGHHLFRKSALDAILQWKFEPLLVNGQPKPFLIPVTLNFRYSE